MWSGCMARRPRRQYRRTGGRRGRARYRSNYVAIPFDQELNLATLADEGVVANGLFGATFGEDIFIVSVDAQWTRKLGTPGDEGPLLVGFAHGDLTPAEIVESLSAELTDPDDIIAKERARRPVRTAGAFNFLAIEETLNDGMMVRTPIRFSVGDGHTLDFWAMAHDPAGLTTGGIVHVHGILYGRWQR